MATARAVLGAASVGFILGALVVVTLSGRDTARAFGLGPRARAAGSAEAHATTPRRDGDEGDDSVRAELLDYAQANEALVRQVSESTRRLQHLDEERAKLQKELEEMKAKLRASQPDAAPSRNPFDLTKADWAELAKNGSVMYRIPCSVSNGWTPPPSKLQELGLAPQDASPIHDAYVASNGRLWSEVEPICAQVAGGDAVAKKIGMNTCIHLVLDASRGADGQATDDAMRAVGEVRAGLREPPKAGDAVSPVLAMFLALTNESERFQKDLTRTFGPDEAHRLAFSDGMCATQAEFGGTSPR